MTRWSSGCCCYGADCGKERTVDAVLVRLDVELLHADRVLPFLVRDGELVGTKVTIDPRNALPRSLFCRHWITEMFL
jgi:hypothetical protein